MQRVLHKAMYGLVLSVLLLGTAQAESKVQQLLEASGLVKQMESVPELIASQLGQAQQQGIYIAASEKAEIQRLALELFAVDQILTQVSAAVGDALSEQEIEEQLQWYQSAQGQAITAAEVRASSPEGVQAILANGAELLADESTVAFAQEVIALIQANEFALEIQKNAAIGMMGVVFSVLQPDVPLDFNSIEAQVAALAPNMLQQVEQFGLLASVYSYKDVDKQDLAAYKAFLNQPASQSFYSATLQALSKSLDSSARQLLQQLSSASR